jgi:hypothetical protein
MACFGKSRSGDLSKTILMFPKKIIFTAAFGLLFVCAVAQENYTKIFDKDYARALQFINEEKWMDQVIISYRLNPKEVKAVVFPELIRYSNLQDKFETFALESLYIQYGKAYANFSIGEFQIKPSFAENIEIDFLKLLGESEIGVKAKDTIQTISNRSARVKRMKSKREMLNYVCLFFKVMENKYPNWKTSEEKIKFFACAYNFDYRKSEREILSFTPRKFFKTSIIASTKYCYSDIALFYFSQP